MRSDPAEMPAPSPTEEADAEPDDAELLRRHRRGDRDAFARLVRRWEGPAYRISLRILGDQGEAEEVRQDVFLKLLRAPESVRDPDRLASWLHASIVNAALTAARRRKRRLGLVHRFGLRAAPNEETSPAEAPPERSAAREDAERLHRAMSDLDPADRALLALRFEEDLTFREIAEATGRPVSTIKSRLAVLVDRLRARLGGPRRDG